MKRFLKYMTGILLGLSLQNTPIATFCTNSVLPKFLSQFLMTTSYGQMIGLVAVMTGLGASHLVEESSPSSSWVPVILV